MKLRDYQEDIRKQGAEILTKHGLLYLAMQVRTGKTITSMAIAESVGAKSVLFVTKKKALSSIENDYVSFMPPFEIDIKNWGSEHKAVGNYDLIILDEAHSCFVEGTLVSGKEIQDIVPGDMVHSFNEKNGVVELKRVKNVFKNDITERLVKIKCDGKEIVCTESHRIFTKNGWKKAIDITGEDELLMV